MIPEPKAPRREGNGIGAALLGGTGGAIAGGVVFGLLGWLASSAALANAEPCTEKLCGLGDALAAAFLFILIAIPGTYASMLFGCWLVLDRMGYAHAGSTVRWLALLAPVIAFATGWILQESFNLLWLVLAALGSTALARWITVKRAAQNPVAPM